jgi:hypothetical protein
MKKRLALFLFPVIAAGTSVAQQGNWDVYIAQYEKGPGSTSLNMKLIDYAPAKELPFLLITGVIFENCREDGFPRQDEFEKLYTISDNIGESINLITRSELVGTFTYQCERLDYIYLKDTTSIRDTLIRLYNSKYRNYKAYIAIKYDPDWDAYVKFLYPGEEIRESMSNRKVIAQLQQSGDKLSKSRPVDHWLYFPDKPSRELFIKYAEYKGFKIESQEKTKDSELPYELHISRVDLVTLEAMDKITLDLRKKAREYKGEYDGWETVVIAE